MLSGLETELVTARYWPGFNERGVLVLPLPAFPAHALPAACEIDGITLKRKSEFHLTLLSRREAAAVRARIDDDEIESQFAALDWTCRATGPCWLLGKAGDGNARSVIVLCAAPALDAFRTRLSSRCDVALAPVPAHVTLFVAGLMRGIGLGSHEAFHAMRVRVVADSEFDRDGARE